MIRVNDMKHCVYLCSAKIDMLNARLPNSVQRRRSFELTASVAVAFVSVKQEAEGSSPSEYDKLAAALDEIQSSGQLGTIDEPGTYFKGTPKK